MPDGEGMNPGSIIEMNPMFLFRWEEAQQAHVLLYPEGVVKLNPSAAAILALCRDGRSVTAILDDLRRDYGGEDDITPDILDFLEVCLGKGWIRIKP